MTSVLACDPDELQASAHALRRAAAELQLAAEEVTGGGARDLAWTGLAALEHAARRAEAADLVRRLSAPLEQVSARLDEVAAAAREHGDLVRRHTRLREERLLERSRLLALGAPPEPLAAAQWQERVAQLQEEQGWHERLVERAEHGFDRVQRTTAELLARVLEGVPPVVADLALLGYAGERVYKGVRQVSAVGSMADAVRRIRRTPVPGGERTLHLMNERIEKHLRTLRLRPPGWAARVPGVAAVAGRALPLTVVLPAGRSLVDGGGYAGLRGGTTRVIAGVAVVGVGGAVLVSAPVAGAVALGAAATYQAWMTGNWVYDNRERIRGAASRTWSRGRSTAVRAWSRGGAVLGRARQRASSGLDRIRERLRVDEGASDQPAATHAPCAPGAAPAGVHA